MLPVKKIYIDSRHSVSDVQNSANFRTELDMSYKMPPDTVFFITDCCIPHSWMTVEPGSSDKIYFMDSDNACVNYSYYVATIPPGIYDGPGFASALSDAMLNICPGVSALYTSSVNKLDIAIAGPATRLMKILTDKEIPVTNTIMVAAGVIWHGGSYDGGYPASCNENIQNFTPSDPIRNSTCNFLNLQIINNVYITSPYIKL